MMPVLYLSNLQNHPLDDAARIKFTGKALSRLNHLEKLIEDMLLFARGGQFELEPVSLQKLLNDLQQQVAPHAEQAGFTFSIRSPILDCPIPANAAALLSALQNLVDNAIQAIGKGGELRLETDKINDRMVRISLIDNGPGIPDQVRERLFEPFVTSRANGTGLGLAVVQAVIRSHQGSIQLRETSSAGTRFEITLPLIGQKQEGAVSL
jgi:two-component system sensor histidine kinase FlrB